MTARIREDVAARSSDRVTVAWHVLRTVPDPELPALSVCELGMIRDVRESAGTLEIVFTPTYAGCPATEVIERAVGEALQGAGLGPTRVLRRLSPPWTTDWIDDEGRRKLRANGIAPPLSVAQPATAPKPANAPDPEPASEPASVPGCRFGRAHVDTQPPACPRCGSTHTEKLSAFGATPCKALYRCVSCREPFEYVKRI